MSIQWVDPSWTLRPGTVENDNSAAILDEAKKCPCVGCARATGCRWPCGTYAMYVHFGSDADSPQGELEI